MHSTVKIPRLALIAIFLAFGGLVGVALSRGLPGEPITAQTSAKSQAFQAAAGSATTSSESFETVPGLSAELCDAKSGVSVTVTMELEGSPVEIRAVMGPERRRLEPSSFKFDSGSSAATTFSATFVRAKERGLPDGPFSVEWRSIDGGETTMNEGTIRVLFGTSKRTVHCD